MTEIEEFKRVVQEVKSLVRKLDGTGESKGMLSLISDLLAKAEKIGLYSENAEKEMEETLKILLGKLTEHKNLLDGGKDYLSDSFGDLLNDAMKKIIEQADMTKDLLVKENEIFLVAREEERKKQLDSMQIAISEGSTKAIKNAVRSLDFGIFEKLVKEVFKAHTSFREVIDVMHENHSKSQNLVATTYESLQETNKTAEEMMQKTIETNELLEKKSLEMNERMQKQMERLDEYDSDKGSSLAGYLMVFTGTSLAWGVGTYFYAPEIVKKLVGSLLTQIQSL